MQQNCSKPLVNNQTNGRVLLPKGEAIPADYETLERQDTQKNFVNEALRGHIARSPLSDLFFSDLNIDALQLGMRNMVLNNSCGKYNIGRQSDKELTIIMRGMYLQTPSNNQYNLVKQVQNLNARVLAFVIPRLLNELQMHDTYLNDISKLPVPLCYGENTSVAGSKYLELKKL